MPDETVSTSANLVKGFAQISVAAHALWRGPENITIQNSKRNVFYGWPYLTLEVRDPQTVCVESRSVYANLFDSTQKSAMLRAAYWDGSAERKRYYAEPDKYDLTLPARFVRLPVQRLRAWLSRFAGLALIVPADYEVDESADIRRLRIQREYVTHIFELVWQAGDIEHAVVNEQWNHVWRQMTKALIEQPNTKEANEDFWFVSPQVRYNFRAYLPKRYLPK